ncbi:MAG: amidohydrolase family protein [Gemmatimonadota bacterium]|nr:amidohydrolase family protein [Gemmatimonadota bacterium]
MRLSLALVLSVVVVAPGAAQPVQRPDSGAPRRDPTNTLTLATPRTVRFTTDQGTWMSVDVSPDGSTIVFDLLGDLYTMPMAGGKATRIVGGTSVDVQPRYSPDGNWIAFMSDRSGVDATWLVDATGKSPRLISTGGSQPAWTPDGRFIVTGNRLVDIRGGAGVPLQGVGTGASFTADGRHIWFQTVNGQQAVRYDRHNGSIGFQTNLPGGVFRPIVSRDGQLLAYFTRYEAKSALVVRTLATGAERWVLVGAQPEAAGPAGFGPLPGSAWLADGKTLVTSFDGKVWKVDIASGIRTQIPFTADVEQSLGALVKGAYKIGDSVQARELRQPALSPDGRRVAFSALGKVWVMDLADRKPRRLTTAMTGVESAPTWSPDGRTVAFATWTDGDGGDIHQVDANGGAATNLTRAPALYSRINFTPDGSRLVFARAPRRAVTLMGNNSSVQPRTATGAGTELGLELRWMAASGGAQHSIAMVADLGAFPSGAYAHFVREADRVFYHDGTALVSVRWDGTDRRVVLAGAAPQTLLAPDGSRVLSQAGRRRQIYLFERPQVADSITIDPAAERPVLPVRRLTRSGGEFPSWSRDGRLAAWSVGSTLYVYDIAQADRAISDSIAAAMRPTQTDSARRPAADTAGAAASRATAAYEATRYEVTITVPADKPAGVVALRGARIVTMKDREVIENGDIVITDNRITAVGARGRVSIPRDARVIDMSGKTILPGFVDVHADAAEPPQAHRTVVAQYLANLAFGVTTTRDPNASSYDVFSYADRVATGEVLGPRVFATGPAVLDSVATLRTPADARDFVGPYASAYRTNTVRADLTATRPDRQRFLTTSREAGLTAVAVGAPDFRKSLSAILDGFANHQGHFEIHPVHGDVAKLIAESGITYTPLLLGRVGGRGGMEHILATEAPHTDAKLMRFYYHKDLDRAVRPRSVWNVAAEYPFADIAAGAARVVAAGGKVAVGSGGTVQGIALHWNLWLLAKGGMHNHDILRAATMNGADAIGAGAELGSLEVGKLADLQVLDRNPLTDIRNSTALRYVMKNGRLYDANTLDQIAPTATKLTAPWWAAIDSIGGTR